MFHEWPKARIINYEASKVKKKKKKALTKLRSIGSNLLSFIES